jgi:phage portal protein BeeE
MVNMLIDSEETAVYLAKKFGVPDGLIRDEADREALQEQMQQMAQMQQMMQMQGGGGE